MRRVGVVLFEGFELLDVAGPLELFGKLPDLFSIELIAESAGPVASAQGPAWLADVDFEMAATPDIALVPGGIGTRTLAKDQAFLAWLSSWAGTSEFVTSVCTGAGLLAAAGLLDGYRATTNKRAFDWPRSQGPQADWIAEARWVQDRNRWTSSGVAAGMDMTLALIAHLHGESVAQALADLIELEWHTDPNWDPFAALNGLTG
ncbi:MAG TPA: DJ-1/PfpI family protein [Microthrixaceae bacterium]|nr:DJ-1/PfpI family protein [Microthrixaceae bacterium]